MSALRQDSREWLEADGAGGFASGTVNGIRTRRYHGLLLVATEPPTGRMVLVNGFEAWVEVNGARFALSSHRYSPDVVHPDGAGRLRSFLRGCPFQAWSLGELVRLDRLLINGMVNTSANSADPGAAMTTEGRSV